MLIDFVKFGASCCCIHLCSATYFLTTLDKLRKYWKHSSRKTRFSWIFFQFVFRPCQ